MSKVTHEFEFYSRSSKVLDIRESNAGVRIGVSTKKEITIIYDF